jgi:hypothetical protein
MEAEDSSLQKLLDLQHRPGHCLGGGSHPRPSDPGQRGRAAHPVDFFRLRDRLGVDDDCPLRLSAAKALGSETPPSVTRSTPSSASSLYSNRGMSFVRDREHKIPCFIVVARVSSGKLFAG